MRKIFMILSLIISINCFSQYYSAEIYQITNKTSGNISSRYTTAQLNLNKDSTFILYYLNYGSKKDVKKNVFLSIDIIKGMWTLSSDTLILRPAPLYRKEYKKEMKYIKKENTIFTIEIIEELPKKYKKYGWRRMN